MNISTRLRFLLVAACALSLGACSESKDTDPTDTTAPDTTSSDVQGDTDPADTAVDETSVADTDDTPDTTPDVQEDTVDLPDTSACQYFDVPRVADCSGFLMRIAYWTDTTSADCPPYYTRGVTRYETFADLAAAVGCVPECEYRATIAVTVIGCISGGRTGYEQYAASADSCLDAVYGTPVGFISDLCEWPERACRSECNADCQKGVVGDIDQAQLSGAGGIVNVSPTQVTGQTFTVGRAGILSGVEVRLGRCNATVPAMLAVFDADGVELAVAELAADAIPDTCVNQDSLAAGAPGPAYFDLAPSCFAVEAGQVLELRVSMPAPELGVCDTRARACTAGTIGESCDTDASCNQHFGLGVADGDPYAGGTMTSEGTAYPASDLAFKVFVK